MTHSLLGGTTAGARARLVAATALLAVGVPVVGVGNAAACAGRAVGRWASLASPTGAPARQLLPLRDTCALLAVGTDGTLWRSAGGRSYAAVPAPPVVRAFAGSGIVVAALRGGGVLASGDDGRTFAPGLGPAGLPVPGDAVAAAVAPDPGTVLLATVSGALPLTTLWRSTDRGRSFAAAGTVPAPAAALAYDPWTPGLVWLAAPAAAGAGLWRSGDGGVTWSRAMTGPAYDLDTARRAGGSLVVVARDDGLWRTTDGGTTWKRTPAPPLAAVRVDNGGPAAYALAGGTPVRVSPGAARPATEGLPPGCAAGGLAADGTLPGTYVLRCGTAWYALVSSSGLGGDPPPPRPPVVGGLAARLSPLRQLALPEPDGVSSGSLAFDGTALYYAGTFAPGADPDGPPIDTVHLMSPVDGRPLGTLRAGGAAKFLAYDARRHGLYVDDGRAMWRVDLRTGRRSLAFPATYGFQHSYDAVSRTFVGVNEGDDGKSLRVVGEHGIITGHCSLDPALDAVLTASPYPSAVAAAADGAYVLLEDDATVVRVGRDCALQATYTVRTISESALENDELVCDPMTFAPRTALWIRDSDLDTVTAYELPGGYCPFVSTLALTLPRAVGAGEPAVACATLRGAAQGQPLAGQPVSFDLDGVQLAAPPTNTRGRTCATGRPAGAGGVARVRARFPGSAQWTAAAAAAATAVGILAPPAPRHPGHRPPPIVGLPHVPAPAGALVAPADPPVPPNPPAEPAPGPQPQAQPHAQQHPAQQPGTLTGVAPDGDEAPQVALAGADDTATAGDTAYAMSRQTAPSAAFLLWSAVLTTAAAGWALRWEWIPGTAAVRGDVPGRPRGPRRRGHAVRRGRR
jgi:hypothetical protein